MCQISRQSLQQPLQCSFCRSRANILEGSATHQLSSPALGRQHSSMSVSPSPLVWQEWASAAGLTIVTLPCSEGHSSGSSACGFLRVPVLPSQRRTSQRSPAGNSSIAAALSGAQTAACLQFNVQQQLPKLHQVSDSPQALCHNPGAGAVLNLLPVSGVPLFTSFAPLSTRCDGSRHSVWLTFCCLC